jgi:hypothetical protein
MPLGARHAPLLATRCDFTRKLEREKYQGSGSSSVPRVAHYARLGRGSFLSIAGGCEYTPRLFHSFARNSAAVNL